MSRLVILCVILMISPLSANAEAENNLTVSTVVSSMTQISNAMKDLLSENDSVIAANEKLVKENNLWQGQLDDRLKPLSVPLIAKIKESKAEEERLRREINRHNSICSGEVPRPQYDKCVSENSVIVRVVAKHKRERNALIKEKSAFDKEWKSYVDLINSNQARINKNFKRHLAIKDSLIKFEKRFDNYKAILVDLCAKADKNSDDEAIHHCHSVAWDGSRLNLPTLDEILKGTQFFK